MFLQTVYNACTHSVFTTEILRKSDVSGWCHFKIGVVPLNSIHVIIGYVNSNTHALLDCITAQLQADHSQEVVLAGNGGRCMGLYFFAENNCFCWIGRVLGWEECVPNFHK